MHNDQGPPLSGFLTITEFARLIGVSQPAVSKAVQAGRLQPYDEAGRPVSSTFRGRKFLRAEEAREAFEYNRVRLDNWWLDRKGEGPKFRLWFAPDISRAEFDEAAGAICRVLVAGPPEPPGHRRAVAVRQCLAQYEGARSNRARQLADRYQSYLASGWPRERGMESLHADVNSNQMLDETKAL